MARETREQDSPGREPAAAIAPPERQPGGGLDSRLHAGREAHAPWVWVNGGFMSAEALRPHFFTHALHYGSGVFEGIRCYPTQSGGAAVFRLHDHMERLLASARFYRMKMEYGAHELGAAALETARRNGIASGYIRPLAFYGEGSIHLTPSLG